MRMCVTCARYLFYLGGMVFMSQRSPFSEGNKDMRELLGGKGREPGRNDKGRYAGAAGLLLSQLRRARSTITTAARSTTIFSSRFMTALPRWRKSAARSLPIRPTAARLRAFGARASMPGMMDTILNLGLNDTVVEGFAKFTNNPRFAYDSYRRFIQMFSDVVMELPKPEFEKIIDQVKERRASRGYRAGPPRTCRSLSAASRRSTARKKGEDFLSDPKVQLMEAVKAVFRSWDNPRANVYRRMNEIPYDWGTAVNVQQMVFGNSGESSGTGVAFTRNPATGEKALFGEYLINAQGEDVVAGVRTPSPISHLKEDMPEVYNQFAEIADRLEKHYKDMQDMEFTIESGKLYMLADP